MNSQARKVSGSNEALKQPHPVPPVPKVDPAQRVLEYLTIHDITNQLNDAVNALVEKLPTDPFNFLANILAPAATIEGIVSRPSCPIGNQSCVEIDVFINFAGSTQLIHRFLLPLPDEVVSEALCIFMNVQISPLLKGLSIKEQEEIDSRLVGGFGESPLSSVLSHLSLGLLKASGKVHIESLNVLLSGILNQEETLEAKPTPILSIFNCKQFEVFAIMESISSISSLVSTLHIESRGDLTSILEQLVNFSVEVCIDMKESGKLSVNGWSSLLNTFPFIKIIQDPFPVDDQTQWHDLVQSTEIVKICSLYEIPRTALCSRLKFTNEPISKCIEEYPKSPLLFDPYGILDGECALEFATFIRAKYIKARLEDRSLLEALFR